MKKIKGAVYGLRVFNIQHHWPYGSSEDVVRSLKRQGFHPPAGLYGGFNRLWAKPTLTATCDITHDKMSIFPLDKLRARWRHNTVPHTPYPAFSDAKCGVNMFSLDYYRQTVLTYIPDTENLSRFTIENALAALYPFVMPGTPFPGCLAITQGTGKIIEHEQGYRVEQARVLHLYMIQYNPWLTFSKEDRTRQESTGDHRQKEAFDEILNRYPSWREVDFVDDFHDFNTLVKSYSTRTIGAKT